MLLKVCISKTRINLYAPKKRKNTSENTSKSTMKYIKKNLKKENPLKKYIKINNKIHHLMLKVKEKTELGTKES